MAKITLQLHLFYYLIILLLSHFISIIGLKQSQWTNNINININNNKNNNNLPSNLLSHDISTKLTLDETSISMASNDFGMMVQSKPAAVFHPTTTQDIVSLINLSYNSSTPFKIAARGRGHSCRGQAMVENGIVIDMTSLSKNYKRNNDRNRGGEDGIRVSYDESLGFYVDVSGGQLWIDVLNATLEYGFAPVSWTDYLYLSVGGTLSNAGISGQSFRYGPQIVNVHELDIITGKGEMVKCSRKENREVFNAVLGGLGQFGIITRARIKLEDAPKRVKWVRMLYDDFSTFVTDQEYLISLYGNYKDILSNNDGLDYVEGSIMHQVSPNSWRSSFFTPKDQAKITSLNTTNGIIYCLEVAKYYYDNNHADILDKELEEQLQGLYYIPELIFKKEVSYVDFLDRVRKGEIELQSKGLWDVPHPWLNIFIPQTRIEEFSDVLAKIVSKDSKVLGPILIYPLNRNKWDDNMSTVIPQEEIFYTIGLLHSSGYDNWQELEDKNKELLNYSDDNNIKIKQYLPHYKTLEEWKSHFGSKWTKFKDMKALYDPKMILSPGQNIFNHYGKGEMVKCSRKENREVFNAVLGGLGQFGIITRARIKLEDAPKRVKWVRMLYDDFSTFVTDQEYLISLYGNYKDILSNNDGLDYVEGSIMHQVSPNSWRSSFFTPKDQAKITSLNTTNGIIYCLEVAKYYYDNNHADILDKELEEQLQGLYYIPELIFKKEVSYVDFLDRVRKGEIELQSKGLWDVPHPWLNIFIPQTRIEEFSDVLAKIVSKDSKVLGPILIYPLNRNKWDDNMSTVIPQEEIFYTIGLLHSSGYDNWQELEDKNKELLNYSDDNNIKIKQYLPHYKTLEEWKSHFGSKWTKFKDMKALYDPKMILSPGQNIFNHYGKGEMVKCSRKENREVFNAVLGGLGQFGIITRARIKLEDAPKRVKWVRMLYDDFSTFVTDQEYLISLYGNYKDILSNNDGLDYVEGSIMHQVSPNSWRSSFFTPKDQAKITSLNTTNGIIYCLEVAKYYYDNNHADILDKELEEQLQGLYYIPELIFKKEVSYVDFIDRVRKGEIELQSKGLWDVPHPWLNIFIPQTRIEEFSDVLAKIVSKDSKVLGPILIYPLNRNKWDDNMSTVIPQEEIFYTIGLLHSSGYDNWQELEDKNKELLNYSDDNNIKIKQYLPHYKTLEEWKSHFGSKWTKFKDMKALYDPKMILSPGQNIFNHYGESWKM